MTLISRVRLPTGPRPCPEYDPEFDGPRFCNCRDCLVELSSSPSDQERYGIEKLAGHILGVPYCGPCLAARLRAKDAVLKKAKVKNGG